MSNKFVIITCVKDEARYIEEWIRYNYLIGVENFIIFDNDSSDSTADVVSSLSNLVNVKYIPWQTIEGKSPQISAFNEGLEQARGEFIFGAFIDVDEFIVPMPGVNFKNWLTTIPNEVSAVAICQRVFGSGGRTTYDNRPVIERFVKSAVEDYDENRWFKSFYRLDNLETITNSHTSKIASGQYVYPNFESVLPDDIYTGKSRIVEGSVMQLHHYILKSREEFEWKRQRGGSSAPTLAKRMERYDEAFFVGRDACINTVDNHMALHALSAVGAGVGLLGFDG